MKTSLQNRLALLMIASSVIFIVTFSSIQLFSHQQNISRFLNYKTTHSVFMIQEAFNRLMEKQSYTPEAFKGVLESLRELHIIEEAAVYDAEGNILAQTEFVFEPPPSKTTAKEVFAIDKPYAFMRTEGGLLGFVRVPQNLLVITMFSQATIQKALTEVLYPIVGIIIFVVIANFIVAIILSKSIITPVSTLYRATGDIAGGNLDLKVDIRTEDELEELAHHFNYMTKELKKMKERAENANPLTKLPGNVVIREDVERRIQNDERFTILYCDLNNFKAFNDKYGVEKGDEAIQLTSDIFKEAVKQQGGPGDFIGHEGGDDFLLVTAPERAPKIAEYIIKEFDVHIRSLYSKEDLDQGFISAKARYGNEILKFPIMGIALGGVTNVHRDITSYAQATNIAAEVKKKAKCSAESCFVVDKRLN